MVFINLLTNWLIPFKVDANGLPLLDNSYRNGTSVSYVNPSSAEDAPISLNSNDPVDPRLISQSVVMEFHTKLGTTKE